MTEPPDLARHAWRIEEREYARQEQRRGRRHAYEHLDPARTALVVVDMVPFFVEEKPYCRGIPAPRTLPTHPRVEDHNAALHTIYRTFDVRPTDEVLDMVATGAPGPEVDALSDGLGMMGA